MLKSAKWQKYEGLEGGGIEAKTKDAQSRIPLLSRLFQIRRTVKHFILVSTESSSFESLDSISQCELNSDAFSSECTKCYLGINLAVQDYTQLVALLDDLCVVDI